jgi:hypothetical protein
MAILVVMTLKHTFFLPGPVSVHRVMGGIAAYLLIGVTAKWMRLKVGFTAGSSNGQQNAVIPEKKSAIVSRKDHSAALIGCTFLSAINAYRRAILVLTGISG